MKAVVQGLIVMTVLAASGAAAHAEEVKYAFVDVANVFDNYMKTKDNDRTLQDSGKKKEEERDALVHEIRQMKDELALMSDDAKAKKQETLNAKMKELQDFDRDARQALGEQRNKVVREIFKDIDDTVQRLGERKAVDMVFNERALLYHNPKNDMTKEVIDELNKGYAKKK